MTGVLPVPVDKWNPARLRLEDRRGRVDRGVEHEGGRRALGELEHELFQDLHPAL